jgi:hypothetical protein
MPRQHPSEIHADVTGLLGRIFAWGRLQALTRTALSIALLFAQACTDAHTQAPQSSSSHGNTGGGIDVALRIEPESPILKLSLPLSGQTVQFHCIEAGTGMPLQGATFSLGSLDLGALSEDGLFTPSGLRTGEVAVRCTQGSLTVQTTLRVLIHAVDTDVGLSPEQIEALRGPPGLSDPEFRFVYPYDKTVFPRGIPSPEIHLSPGIAPGEAFYVRVVANDFEYEGFFNKSSQSTQLQMSQPAWDALTRSVGGSSVEVHSSKLSQGKKYGPIYRTWVLAPGKLHGTIYYNTYDSMLAQKTGAVMRIKGASSSPEVLIGGCTVCHGVSADGSTLAAANHAGPGGTFDLSGGALSPPIVWQEPERAAFAALYPKYGEVLVTSAMPGSYWPPNTAGTSVGPWTSELRTRDGMLLSNSGIEAFYAQTPAFSHDGSRLAFTDRDPIYPNPSVLALLRYDAAARKFSGYEILATPNPGHHLSWPTFTPDGRYIIYQDGQSADLATWNETSPTNEGRIFAVDVDTKQLVYLLRLNGDGAMPAGTRDERKNYIPAVAPIGSGGYFWVMFTSRRTYGNKLIGSEQETKRLWVAAFDIAAPPGVDPSHPAFYVAGQELTSGNTRGFWVLDPCKKDGEACETGDECCEGRCDPKGEPPVLLCGPPDDSCSNEFEVCLVDADCCEDENLTCIGGKCTLLPPK